MHTVVSSEAPIRYNLPPAAICALVVGIAARLYLYYQIPIINPDGALYIQQAKALHFRLFDDLLSYYDYLSPYSIFISIAYGVTRDWVLAAQSISIIFGSLTIIPLFWLLRQFLKDTTASLTTFVFALLPAYALVSRDVLRGPIFWFFAVMGLFFFISHMKKRRPWALLFSSICFGMAAWARIEGALFILVSGVFLLLIGNRGKWSDLILFLSPYSVLLMVGAILSSGTGVDFIGMLTSERIIELPTDIISRYKNIRNELKTIYQPDIFAMSRYFFDRIRSLVWVIALLSLIVQIAETLFYFFFVFFVFGIVSWLRNYRKDKYLLYMGINSLMAIVLLYFQTLYAWHSTSRQLAVFLFPAFVFIGLGIETSIDFLTTRRQWKPAAGYAIICAFLMLIFIPKILRAHFEQDQLVYRQIGRYISHRDIGQKAVTVCGAFKWVRDIHFYANLDTAEATCANNGDHIYQCNFETLRSIHQKNYDYFVWDQKNWQEKGLNQTISSDSRFHKIKEWDSKKLGKLILYEVVQ